MVKTSTVAMMLMALGLMAGQARAGLVPFVGEDLQPNPGPSVRTNSDAAAAAFHAAALAVAPVGTITFESAPLGAFTNLTVAPGVTMNGKDYFGVPQTIRDTTNFPPAPSLDGSNTTPGGANFIEINGGNLTFTFATPTQFFGVYLTGVQTPFSNDSVTFSDGTSQSISLVGAGTSISMGEIAFIGFVDAGKSITSITINTGFPPGSADIIGADDVSYQLAPQVVPEPSSLVLCVLAAVPASWFARARIRARA